VNLRGHLLRGVFGSLGLTVATAGLTFINGVLLARLLGAANYGIYASAIAIVLLLSLPLTLGFDRLLIRDVAASDPLNTWARVRGLIHRAVQIVLPVSIAAIVIVGVGALVLEGSLADETLPVLWLALLMIPLLVLTTLRRSISLGLQRIVSSQLPDAIIRPGLFVVLLAIAYVAVGTISAAAAMALNLFAVAVAFLVGLLLLWYELPPALRGAAPQFETRRWMREALPFALSTAALTIMNQIDVVLVGSLAGATSAGLYAVAARGAGLALFGALAVNTTLAPTASQLWTQHERARLQHVVTRGARGAFVFALGVAVVLWIFGPQFLLLFGPEFVAANSTMAVLAVAQVIDCGFGLGGLMLSMTGLQGINFASVAVAVVFRVGLDVALIPSMGAMGAAVAAVISIAIFNALTAWFTWRRLRIDATPVGLWHPQLAT